MKKIQLFLGILTGMVMLLAVSGLTANPVYAGEIYIVQPGDTLSSIAAEFDTTIQAIIERLFVKIAF